MSETVIMRDILVAVSALPQTLVWRNNTGVGVAPGKRVVRFGLLGSSDIIGVHRGRAVAIEAKAPRGRQSDEQRRFQAAWERAGGIYILARSADEALAELARRTA